MDNFDPIFLTIWNKVLQDYLDHHNDGTYASCCGVFFTRYFSLAPKKDKMKHKLSKKVSVYLGENGIKTLDDFVRTWRQQNGEVLPSFKVLECSSIAIKPDILAEIALNKETTIKDEIQSQTNYEPSKLVTKKRSSGTFSDFLGKRDVVDPEEAKTFLQREVKKRREMAILVAQLREDNKEYHKRITDLEERLSYTSGLAENLSSKVYSLKREIVALKENEAKYENYSHNSDQILCQGNQRSRFNP
jgi:vacuolar-type H+-ATPase subunit I/STV1